MRPRTVRISGQLLARATELAARQQISLEQLVREALELAIARGSSR